MSHSDYMHTKEDEEGKFQLMAWWEKEKDKTWSPDPAVFWKVFKRLPDLHTYPIAKGYKIENHIFKTKEVANGPSTTIH